MSCEVKKTIFMSKEQHEKWDKALRSGQYEQCEGTLYDGVGYCCLGVLEHCLTGDVERWTDDEGQPIEDEIRGEPSLGWLRDQGIQFQFRGEICNGPGIFASKMGEENITVLNDSGRYNFNQLADLIQQHVEYV